MSVSKISTAMSASSWGAYNQKLSQATRQKLDELGISYDNQTTEIQAQRLIQNVQKSQGNKNSQANLNNQQQGSNNELFEKAKSLAEKLSITVDKNTSFEDLLSEIEETLKEKATAATSMQDLQLVKSYGRELADIQSQSQGGLGLNSTSQVLMMSLEMMSQYNKSMLNS